MTERWLVTGGCGFIGANLVRSLLARPGVAVRIVDDLSSAGIGHLRELCQPEMRTGSAPADLGPVPGSGVEVVVGDVTDSALAHAAAAGADVIVHLAARTSMAASVADPLGDCRTNVIGTLNYLEAARRNGVRRFVYPFSGAPSDHWLPPSPDTAIVPRPFSPNGASKLAGAGYCAAYAQCYGLETVGLRFQNLYGPASSHKESVVARFIRRALAGEVIEIYGDGQQTRDFLYIDDLVEAIRRAAAVDGLSGAFLEVATNVETTVGEVVDKIVGLLARAGVCDMQVCHTGPRLPDVRRNTADLETTARTLGWSARVDLSEGLRRTVDWFLARDTTVRTAAE